MKFKFPWTRKRSATPEPRPTNVRKPFGFFNTHQVQSRREPVWLPEFPQPQHATAVEVTSDSVSQSSGIKAHYAMVNTAQLGFFASAAHSIGYQACAMLATNWLIDKACSVPARDAVRRGYTGIPDELRKQDGEGDGGFNVNANLRELIHFGRVYGGRLVLFEVDHENPDEWYRNPFNIDGVKPGMYKGMSQIDPNWITPDLTESNLRDPAAKNFYNPTYWRVGDRVIHRSHFYVFTPFPVPDFLKPAYNYLGISVPQRIMERVYAAERSANEGPQLLMTKRLVSVKISQVASNQRDELDQHLEEWVARRDNYGTYVHGEDEEVGQMETALADVDSVIMTQYQLVAAAANVPVTELLGTQARGFNATGESDEAGYRKELESVQTNDLTPLLMRHYQLVAASLGIPFSGTVIWAPLDSPTRKEFAEIEEMESSRDLNHFNMGALDAEDIRNRLRSDREGSYYNIEKGSYENPLGQAGQVGPGAASGAVPGLAAGTPDGGGQ
ncbi:DUF1073 domain-containing protein [Stenotrophomonas phage B2]|nr:DUF1073 domain-containing protein [Stenotrophomonas phage B2]